MTDLKAREEQLRTRLAELMGRLHRIDDHLQEPPEKDWQDNAIESEMDEVLEGLGQAGSTEVQAIHAALERIQSGTYGACVRCGAEISTERLDVLPHTPLCRDCARESSLKT
ncbi:MAG: TraR/DksA family transcriptional regulator [Hyphomicrobiaceae bacterium]